MSDSSPKKIVHYQPIFCANKLEPISVEALMRPPYTPQEDDGSFAESILGQALHDLPKIKQLLGKPDLKVQVNFTARDIAQDNFPDLILRCLNTRSINPKDLVIEITEHFAIEAFEITRSNLAKCAALGIHILLDDFGRGYSNIEWLISLPISGLKFDREMIAAFRTRKTSAVMRHLCALAKDLNWATTAEGVEDLRDIPELRSFTFNQFQGFALCRPAAIGEWEFGAAKAFRAASRAHS